MLDNLMNSNEYPLDESLLKCVENFTMYNISDVQSTLRKLKSNIEMIRDILYNYSKFEHPDKQILEVCESNQKKLEFYLHEYSFFKEIETRWIENHSKNHPYSAVKYSYTKQPKTLSVILQELGGVADYAG
jgi:hypothetical protein